MFTTTRRYGILALAAAAVGIAACKARDEGTRSDTAAGAIAANDSARAADSARSHGGWTDEEILGFTSVANISEIEEGRLAEKKATNAAVKAFAREIRADHQAMLEEGKSFASKSNVVPDTTRGEVKDALKDSQDEYKDLNDKKAGKDWDEEYIDKQIDGHKKTLEKLQDAEKATTNPQLKEMLNKAVGKVQQHLTKAEDIKANKLKD